MDTRQTAQVTMCLDFTLERRELARSVIELEHRLADALDRLDRLRLDIDAFTREYDERLRPLRARIMELEHLILKYRDIGENVDEFLSFDEAEKIYEDAMNDRRDRIEEEFRRHYRKSLESKRKKRMAPELARELKRLYWKLAQLFHPDIKGGDAKTMAVINKAYAQGDLETLRAIETEREKNHVDETTVEGLRKRIVQLTAAIDDANGEIHVLKRSDMFIAKKDLERHARGNPDIFEPAVRKSTEEIAKSEAVLTELMDKLGITGEVNPDAVSG